PKNGQSIGVGKTVKKSDYTVQQGGPLSPQLGVFPHGLQTTDPQKTIHKNDPTKVYQYPYDAYAYMLSPDSTVSNPVPRGKDTFVLISAGIDRVYGTEDDICSFGDLKP